MNCRAATMAAVLSIMGAISACKGRQRVEGETPARMPAFILGESLPTSGVIDAASLYEITPGERTYAIVNEDGEVQSQIVAVLASTDRYGAGFSRAEGVDRTEFLRRTEQGDIVLTAVVERDDNAVSHFNPPLLVMPAELAPNEVRSSEASMRVMEMKNPTKRREAGTARRSVTYVGDQRIVTPLGEFVAKRVESRFEADLKMADAKEYVITFLVEGLGVVAEQISEEIKVFGTFGSKKSRTLVLIESP